MKTSQIYDRWLDGKRRCAIIPHRDVSPKYRLIQFEDGERAEVFFRRVKDKPLTGMENQSPMNVWLKKREKEVPQDIFCLNCGSMGRNPQVCEECGQERYAGTNWLKKLIIKQSSIVDPYPYHSNS